MIRCTHRCLTFGDLRFRAPAVARGFRGLRYFYQRITYLN